MIARGVKIKIKDLDEEQPFDKGKLTNFEVAVQGEKSIVVPSFGTTSVLFTRHLGTLRQLRRRIDLLKQGYYD